jgi:hypothetical protein
MRLGLAVAALVAALATVLSTMACSGSATSSRGGAGSADASACEAGETLLESGGCQPAGLPPDAGPCEAGALALDGGGCQPAGVPACGAGFGADDAGGCDAVLPPAACPKGQMAVPGETTCRDVAPCANGSWGDVPVDATTQFVDGSYAGGASDGTSQKPWTTIAQAVAAAAPGAIVAVAAGSYAEDVVIHGKAVRLWGRCPSQVAVAGTASGAAAVYVQTGADGAEIHDLAVTGGAKGILVSGSKSVVVDRAWVHDTAGAGIDVKDALGAAGAAVSGSLVEAATALGVVVVGADATIDATVVRGTLPSTGGQLAGRGIEIDDDQQTSARASVKVTRSVVDDNRQTGIFVQGADMTIESSVVRGTQPQASDQKEGRGIEIDDDPQTGARSTATVRTSVVDGNREVGIYVQGADATLEACVVRGTQPRAGDQKGGEGIAVVDDPASHARANATVSGCAVEGDGYAGILVQGSDAAIAATLVRDTQPQAGDQTGGVGIWIRDDETTQASAKATVSACLVENNRTAGVFVQGADVQIEGTVVQGTQPQASDQAGGYGIDVEPDPGTHASANATVDACLVENNRTAGVLVLASTATIEASVVRGTQPQASDLTAGVGIDVLYDPATFAGANATVRDCVVDGNREVGVLVLGSTATIEGTLVTGTQAQANDGSGGDGMAVAADLSSATATITASRVEGSARAGIAVFGAALSLDSTELGCNAIELDGEQEYGQDFQFDASGGGNSCDCPGATVTCQVLSSGLAPPKLIAPPQ